MTRQRDNDRTWTVIGVLVAAVVVALLASYFGYLILVVAVTGLGPSP